MTKNRTRSLERVLPAVAETTYSLTIVDGKGYLRFVATGERTIDSVIAMAWEIINICAERGADTVLVDVSGLRGRLRVFDSLAIVRDEFPKLRWQGILKKAAIVDRQENRFRLRFFEAIAKKRGYNLRTFVDAGLARQWLRESNNRTDG